MYCSFQVSAWVGLVKQNGVLAFIDGSPLSYVLTKSFSNYPNENCTSIGFSNSRLYDVYCTTERKPLCQFQSLINSIGEYFHRIHEIS